MPNQKKMKDNKQRRIILKIKEEKKKKMMRNLQDYHRTDKYVLNNHILSKKIQNKILDKIIQYETRKITIS